MAALSVLRARVRNNVGGRTDKDTIIDTLINNVLNDISRKMRFNDLMSMDSSLELDTDAYSASLPSTVRLVEVVKLLLSGGSTYYNVKVLDRQTFRDYNAGEMAPTTSGTPTMCYIAGRTIYFNKKSDVDNTAIWLDVFIYPVDMVEDTDTPSISGIDELIVALATSRFYMHLKQPEAAKEWNGLASMIAGATMDEVVGPPVDHLEPS
jgi:hypothetical protein